MTYTLSFQVTTSTDPSQLLDLLISMSEQLANECDAPDTIDECGFVTDGYDDPTVGEHCVEEITNRKECNTCKGFGSTDSGMACPDC